jgi:hypothetical protein
VISKNRDDGYAHWVTIRRPEIGVSWGKSICDLGFSLELVSTTPTLPEEYILSLWNSVIGLPVRKGVEDATSPIFKERYKGFEKEI